jgi:hypothetical protein
MPIGCQPKHATWYLAEGETDMAGKGKRDKGIKTQKKKPQHTLKEKRKLKQEKTNKPNISSIE